MDNIKHRVVIITGIRSSFKQVLNNLEILNPTNIYYLSGGSLTEAEEKIIGMSKKLIYGGKFGELIKEFDITGKDSCLFHAYSANPRHKAYTLLEYIDLNVDLPVKIITNLLALNPSSLSVVNCSSSSIYDRINVADKISEDSKKTDRSDWYGYSKLICELKLSDIAANSKKRMKLLHIRIPVLLGNYVRGNFLTKIRDQIINGVKPTIAYPNFHFNACTTVENVIDCALSFYRNEIDLENCAVNVGAIKPAILKDIFELNRIEYDEVEYERPPVIYNTELANGVGIKMDSAFIMLQKYIFFHCK